MDRPVAIKVTAGVPLAAGPTRGGRPSLPRLAGDNVDVDIAALALQLVAHGAEQGVPPARAGGLADDDLGDVAAAGVPEN
jgi:hypothetical protein